MLTQYRLRDPLSPFRSLARNFALVLQMTRRDVVGRYRGSFIGLMWSFFNPLLMLGVYTFVFGFIFKSRWNAQVSNQFDFAVILFAGLNMNTFFADAANRAPTLIIDNTNFVKKVVFPLETLSWSVVGSGLFHLLISTMVLLLIELLVMGSVPWTIVLFPVVVAIFTPFVAGTVWLLSSLGVFLRDLKQAIGIITAVMMFLAPIFYPITIIPAAYRKLLYLNPLTEIVRATRGVMIWGTQPDWKLLGIYFVVATAYAWLSFVWFERTRKGFADVL